MVKFETVNELSLKVTFDNAGGIVYTKAGAFIGGRSGNGKNYQFEKMLLGPGGTTMQAALGHVSRRLTGENLPLMKVSSRGTSELYFANMSNHVVVLRLNPGETLSVESENILAFTSDVKYSVKFLAQGVISQKGLVTSTLTGYGPESYVAILVDGNPLMFDNRQQGEYLTVDPDCVVAWIGKDPGFKMDLSWKNLIGQSSGESYMFEWSSNNRAAIIFQPSERVSGIDVGIDGQGGQPYVQDNNLFRQGGNQMFNGMSGMGTQSGNGFENTVGSILGNLINR